MVLFLTEKELRESLRMEDAIPVLEFAFRRQGEGKVSMPPRMKIEGGDGRLMIMPVLIEDTPYMGLKVYTVFREVRYVILLYSAKDGSLLAIMDADYIGQVRTGAVSGVATKWMTQEGERVVGILGSGTQARTQLQALHSIGRVEEAKVFSPNADHRRSYAKEMSQKLKTKVVAVESPREAVEGSGIVCSATPSTQPIIRSEWLSSGSHINAVGSTLPRMRELDEDTIKRARMIIVDSKEQVLAESGDIIFPVSRGLLSASEMFELGDLLLGRSRPRQSGDLTVFKSVGTALQDISVAGAAYESALKKGRGKEIGEIASRSAASR